MTTNINHTETLKIITNNHQRDLVALHDIPVKEQHWFDYIKADDRYTPRLFEYLGSWYDTHEFDVTDYFANSETETKKLTKWDGYQSDSCFSGIVIRWGKEWDGQTDYYSVVVGRYYS